MADIDISVIVPTFRREYTLLEAIGSVLAQQGVTFEIIVVDDSPEGSARSAVAAIVDSRITYLKRPRPSGGRPARVRNDGARMAQGRYLHFLDDDDMLKPDALATLARALEAQPQAGMAFGAIEPFGLDPAKLEHDQKYFREARRIAARLRGGCQLSASLLFRPTVLVTSACMTRREAFLDAGGFDGEIPVCEDVDLWARIALATGSVFVDQPVLRYRTGAPSLMHDLVADDEKLHVSYQIIQGKYRRKHGVLRFYAMKLWARVILR
jgi:glycosyltransferase involved in cell wall biosynthesis